MHLINTRGNIGVGIMFRTGHHPLPPPHHNTNTVRRAHKRTTRLHYADCSVRVYYSKEVFQKNSRLCREDTGQECCIAAYSHAHILHCNSYTTDGGRVKVFVVKSKRKK